MRQIGLAKTFNCKLSKSLEKESMKKQKNRARRKSKFQDHNYSDLASHKKDGTKLRPPLMQLDKIETLSWRDDHLPPMLWAALLCAVFPRSEYLGCFREVLNLSAKWFAVGGAAYKNPPENTGPENTISFTTLLDHEAIARLPDEQFETFIHIPLRHPLGYAALRPIALFDSIPGIERWRKVLGVPYSTDWLTVGRAVAATLDRQSEASTDIRWFKVMLPILAGRVQLPNSFHSRKQEIFEFPKKGDMRSVRPLIRSMEMAFRRMPGAEWVESFWQECADQTICMDPTNPDDEIISSTGLDRSNVLRCRFDTIDHFMKCRNSTRADSRLDSSFGLVFYALSIADELGDSLCHEGVLGRLGLRALVEAYVTLRYLCVKNEEKLWSSWRVFGAGQAKLAFLKAQETTGDLPVFIDEEALYQIANEDVWQEFLEIDIGHWAKANLRSIADQCGAKEIYDKYYSWSSTFVHSHWGAIRDTNFITCQNPLHRLHRIPRVIHRRLTSMELDAVSIVNEMLELLYGLYPSGKPTSRLVYGKSATKGEKPSGSDDSS